MTGQRTTAQMRDTKWTHGENVVDIQTWSRSLNTPPFTESRFSAENGIIGNKICLGEVWIDGALPWKHIRFHTTLGTTLGDPICNRMFAADSIAADDGTGRMGIKSPPLCIRACLEDLQSQP